MMDDRALLDEFVRNGSQTAFHELVQRHLPIVYSAARRMVRDSQLAEEVAQSVFSTLAQKARTIRPPHVLGGWLYNTTRHYAMHAVRTEQRRREREQIACAMQALEQTPSVPEIADHLEPAMAELDPVDRDALVLRYLANRGLRELGTELGISEEAARKRVTRALERLRVVLEQRAVSTTTVVLTAALASSLVAVPNGLGGTIATTALLSTTPAVVATFVTLKAKAVFATIAGLVLVGVGAGAFLLQQPAPAPVPASSTNRVAIKFVNDAFAPAEGYLESMAVAGQQVGPALLTMGAMLRRDERFLNEVALNVRRTTNSMPAGHIKCLLKPASSGSAEYLSTLSSRPLQSSRFLHHILGTNSPFLGQRIRVSGWLKTRDVEVRAGMSVVILNAEGHIFASDPMTDRPIRDTTDWQEIEIITDVPAEACTLYLGPTLYGHGELWADDFQVTIAPADKPITDDRIWHVWSPNPTDYTLAKDFKNQHDGHPSLCLSYTPAEAAPAGSWMWWGQDIRNPDKYRGQVVRMTVWIKSEHITDRVRPNLRPKGAYFKLLAQDKILGGKPIRGTTDWTLYTITCRIPADTQCLDTGFAFHGGGKFWVDMDSLKYEIIETENR